MINSQDFKTKTIQINRKNISVDDSTWGIALDIGFSSVKGMSQNKVYSFPSYAKKIPTNSYFINGMPDTDDIIYRDKKTKELWAVGSFAQKMITSDDTKDSKKLLYNRNRYFSPMFKVITSVGIAMGLTKNEFGDPTNKNILIQTGLPPAYLSDSELLIESMSGSYNFDLKIGNNQWQNFKFKIEHENINRIIAQPMGTLLSIATDNNGMQIPEAKKYFKNNVLIFDPGFGTFDIFNIRNSCVELESSQTFDDLGMERVFEETTNKISNAYNTKVAIPALQNYLETGKVKIFDRKNKSTKKIDFTKILEESNKKICIEALERTENIFNDLFDHDYLIVTGGTGEAWLSYIKDRYKDMDTLEIINGNQNDNLPFTFSNVRGYYMYLLGKIKRNLKK